VNVKTNTRGLTQWSISKKPKYVKRKVNTTYKIKVDHLYLLSSKIHIPIQIKRDASIANIIDDGNIDYTSKFENVFLVY